MRLFVWMFADPTSVGRLPMKRVASTISQIPVDAGGNAEVKYTCFGGIDRKQIRVGYETIAG